MPEKPDMRLVRGPWKIYDGSIDNPHWIAGYTIGMEDDADARRICDIHPLSPKATVPLLAELIAAAPELKRENEELRQEIKQLDAYIEDLEHRLVEATGESHHDLFGDW